MKFISPCIFVPRVGGNFLTVFFCCCCWWQKTLVSVYWSARFVKCIHKMHAHKHFKHKANYLIQQIYVYLNLIAYFFLCFRLISYSHMMRNRMKNTVTSSLWYIEALHFVCMRACVTMKRKCRTNSKHDTKPVSIRQRKIQRQRRTCHNEKKVPGKQQAQHDTQKLISTTKKTAACVWQIEEKVLANSKHLTHKTWQHILKAKKKHNSRVACVCVCVYYGLCAKCVQVRGKEQVNVYVCFWYCCSETLTTLLSPQ